MKNLKYQQKLKAKYYFIRILKIILLNVVTMKFGKKISNNHHNDFIVQDIIMTLLLGKELMKLQKLSPIYNLLLK
ncbi:hypothetical protein M0Q97_05280 [Candidatus Dojkabacteria bacterium]|jgi:hypothetical protein|nr:hypothetical protein [Candidatus Dojkabacteria bacterium]